MKYLDSREDKSLRKWFQNDSSCALLRSITLEQGEIRGLTPFSINIDYPITVIAGKNGAGKSTLLALACCAFHNTDDGYKPPVKTNDERYYTFAEFFIQCKDEIPPEGIEISYGINHNNWVPSLENPDGVGIQLQVRKKRKGGRWNTYSNRLYRNVCFIGISRILPHTEKSLSKSYSKSFSEIKEEGWENQAKDIVGKILNKKYDSFQFITHKKHRLPLVKSKKSKYSGFNMGAGESALFEVLSVIFTIPEGSLIVIDELEIGLHAEAQVKLVKHLKEICLKRKLQIVCTTHSREIFDKLPPDARVYIENTRGKTEISYGLSSDHAFSKLIAARSSNELTVFVEDDIAKKLLSIALPKKLRSRLNIEDIGSCSMLSRQLGIAYSRGFIKHKEIIIFDGDQRSSRHETSNLNLAYKTSESKKDKYEALSDLKKHIGYLPGSTWPEKWILEKVKENPSIASKALNIDDDELLEVLENALDAEKHKEFYELSKQLGLDDPETTLTILCTEISKNYPEDFYPIIELINKNLE